jgi:hypothetical protein
VTVIAARIDAAHASLIFFVMRISRRFEPSLDFGFGK